VFLSFKNSKRKIEHFLNKSNTLLFLRK